MKSFFAIFFLLSVHVHAGVKSEIWKCEDQGAVLSAEFSLGNHSAILNVSEDVGLSFSIPHQKSALNGSLKTLLKGRLDSWDHMDYRVALIRPNAVHVASNGPSHETYEASALIEMSGEYDCYGEYKGSMVLKCEVHVYR